MSNSDYELPSLSHFSKKRILAFDPGSVNMGVSLVELKGNKPVVLFNATLMHPLHSIVNFKEERVAFLNEVQQWIDLYKPKAIVAERFQSRGLKGATVECVSMMLGMLSMLDLPVLFITASTWKNKYQRKFNCNLRDVYKTILTTPHQLDASLIGCYGLEVGTKQDYDFTLKSVIKQVEKTALNRCKRK